MRFLFVHQNFPGQFRHVAQALAEDPRHEVVGIGDVRTVKPGRAMHPRLQVVAYPSPRGGGQQTHPYLRNFEGQVRRGQKLFRAAMQLKATGFVPDVVVVHPGWGEALFLRELFPAARHIHYCEYFYRADGGDVGFDPEFPVTVDGRAGVHVKNSAQLLGLTQCDAGISPTLWQRSRYPAEYQPRIRVLHEGIDTARARPDAQAVLAVGGRRFRAGDEIVTFVARNLEPYRGFHGFMRALPGLQALRPAAQILIVGGDEVSYGRRLPAGESYRQKYRAEIADRIDASRIHFLGKLPYDDYLKVLQVSAAHVYLTYPFVLSWSMLEAMACGCLVVASATAPVQEMIVDGENGLLTDFFDADMLARKVAGALADPQAHAPIRARARAFVVQNHDLRTHCLPAWVDFLTQGEDTTDGRS
ncbi:glycosyltransferase family 4 protein [Denitromonas iodatirespirans]|uniref:Glycosyltransferase family 4 protein n=1 Tax=Denitromonas iodatirespirans TaxID=2795389 RepID=A0A944HD80_DENI1|nr:glycosyltransferase family 4 protein [Denitromonas iodatirespirans]MBT0963457.1 glycosyltransferase family 4 protein [Denitromonas iodatirespirans]